MLLGAGSVVNAFDSPRGMSSSGPAAAPTGASSTAAVQKSFDIFTDELAADWMRANPVAATLKR
jgi:hypothetical protein